MEASTMLVLLAVGVVFLGILISFNISEIRNLNEELENICNNHTLEVNLLGKFQTRLDLLQEIITGLDNDIFTQAFRNNRTNIQRELNNLKRCHLDNLQSNNPTVRLNTDDNSISKEI